MVKKFENIKCISLDLDGTLLDSNPLRLKLGFIYQYLRLLAPQHGYIHALRSLRRIEAAIEHVNGQLIMDRAVQAFAISFAYNTTDAEQHYQEMLKTIFSNLRSQFIAMPNVPKYVTELAKSYTLVLGTNPVWPPAIAAMRLSWGNIEIDDFKLLTHAGNFHAPKPNIEYYQELIDQCGYPADQILHIGNSMHKDAPAAEVGIRTAILTDSRSIRYENGLFLGTWQQFMDELL